jgi:hypothetical protein
MKCLPLVLMMLLIPAPALAQDKPDPDLRLPTAAFLTAAGADWFATHRFLNRLEGAGERNPIVGWAAREPSAMVAMGGACDILSVWAWNKYVGQRKPRLAKVGLYVAAAARMSVAIHSERKLRQHTRAWDVYYRH